MRWEAIMRGTWVLAVVVGRMVLKVWGLGADGRIALGMFWKSERRKQCHTLELNSLQLVTNPLQSVWIPVNRSGQTTHLLLHGIVRVCVYTYAEDALPEWPNGGWGGAEPAGWRSSMQHGFGPEKDGDKDVPLLPRNIHHFHSPISYMML